MQLLLQFKQLMLKLDPAEDDDDDFGPQPKPQNPGEAGDIAVAGNDANTSGLCTSCISCELLNILCMYNKQQVL